MKRVRLFAVLSAVLLALAFAGCNGTTDGPDNSGNAGNQENGGNQGNGGNQENGGNQGNQDDPPAPVIYQFHDTVTVLPAGTDGTAGTSATYVLFGDWPQTVKAEGVEVDDDDNAETTITRGGFTYYLGSDDNYYVKCTVHSYGNNYSYSDGRTVNRGQQYFKVEPIKWRILTNNYDNGKKLILAEKILTSDIMFYLNSNNRTIGSNTVDPCDYKYSTIRAYLNGSYETDDTQQKTYENVGFLQSAFSTSAQGSIVSANVDNTLAMAQPENCTDPGWGGIGYSSTYDKIFLLSENEVTKGSYGFDAYTVYIDHGTERSSRVRKPTDYALANFAAIATANSNYGGSWMTRSAASRIRYFSAYTDGRTSTNDSYDNNVGIVPALCIN